MHVHAKDAFKTKKISTVILSVTYKLVTHLGFLYLLLLIA
jgi:hypothetical protein